VGFKKGFKTDKEEACLMIEGSWFHSFGAATAKVQSTLSFILVLEQLGAVYQQTLKIVKD